MKKIISTLFVAVALMVAGTQAAQAQFSWGIKGGVNLSKVDFSDAPANLKADNFTGFFVGPMAEFTLPIVGLGVDGSLLYSQTGMSFTDKEDGAEETLKSHSIEIPINLKYSIGLGKLASVYAAAGPQFAFALSQDEWKEDLANYTSKPFKKSQLSLNLGLGVKLINHLQAGVTYNIPLGDTADFDGLQEGNAGDIMDAGWSAFTAKNKTWKIHVAYIF